MQLPIPHLSKLYRALHETRESLLQVLSHTKYCGVTIWNS